MYVRHHLRIAALSLVMAGLARPVVAGAYDVLQANTEWLRPIPLRYATADESRDQKESMTALLFGLARDGDAILLMGPDGTFTAFKYHNLRDIYAQSVPQSGLDDYFAQLQDTFARVWIVLVDPQAGWQAQPPGRFARALREDYMRVPVAMPVYYGRSGLAVGSTNYWKEQAQIMERVLRLTQQSLNPELFLKLGQAYVRCGAVSNAVAAYERGIAEFPRDPYLHQYLGTLYFEAEPPRYQESIEQNRLADQYHRQTFGSPMHPAMFKVALAYQRLGEMTKAQLQYNDILRSLEENPDRMLESSVRRYLAAAYLEAGRTNDAILQFQIDTSLAGRNPTYPYNRLLDLFTATGAHDAYGRLAETYWSRYGSNEPLAVVNYARHLERRGQPREVIEAVKTTKAWMHANTSLVERLRANTSWWGVWTNLTLRHGLAPVP